MQKAIDQIKKDLETYNITYLRLQFTDLSGKAKNVEISTRKLDEALEGKILFDGSSIQGFTRIHEADMLLKADPKTWKVLHYENTVHHTGVGRFICDVLSPDGTPFAGDPRYVLKKTLEQLESYGFADFKVGLEPEFYLLKDIPSDVRDIQLSDSGGYFDQAPIDESEDCRREIVYELEKMGYIVEASHHEVGPGQNEITWKYASALETADNLQTFKAVVRHVAKRHQLVATFMPKIFSTLAGSGMHTNVSLFDHAGNNAFYDPQGKDQLSDTAYYFMGGILAHAIGFCAITNSTVNSYKRLVPGFEAPCYVAYADCNRSALVRIPASRQLGTRVEIRCPDPLANPYLALAVILASGLEGINHQLLPQTKLTDDIFDYDIEQVRQSKIACLPSNLLEALELLKADPLMKETLGAHVFDKFHEIKLKEWERYHIKVSRWELANYFIY